MRRIFNYVQRRVILEAYESDMTEQEIADELGVSQPTISQAIKQARYERRIEEYSGREIVIVGILRDLLRNIEQFENVSGYYRRM